MDDFLSFLIDNTESEFPWLDGLDGGHFVTDLAGDDDLFDWLAKMISETSQYIPPEYPLSKKAGRKQLSPSEDLHKQAAIINYLNRPKRPSNWKWTWPIDAFIVVRPEGYGKSSIVRRLIQLGHKIVFCSKSNKQLIDHEVGIRQRWPELRIDRYMSKAQHLREHLATIGIDDFELVTAEPLSPYSLPQVLKTESIEELAKRCANAEDIYREHYEEYKSPRLDGLNLDLMLLTLSAFQALAMSWRDPWWVQLGLATGTRTVEWNGKDIEKPVGYKKVVVIIDDPDLTDFDWLRALDDEEHADDLFRRRRKLREPKSLWATLDYWIQLGHSPRYAKELAAIHDASAVMHNVKTFGTHFFEQRPRKQTVGFGFTKGYPNTGERPKLLILTTEEITADYARKTMRHIRLKQLYTAINKRLPITKQCHVTTISTRLVRRGNQGVLIAIAEQLRKEFPNEDLCFIANGLGAEHNLSNVRGLNTMSERSTIIKLSIPNPTASVTLNAHYELTTRPRELNAWYLADAANQALGRNQGHRWTGRVAVLLIDPIYYKPVVERLRYVRTPWSSDYHKEPGFVFHDQQTLFEARLLELLRTAHKFGRSQQALDAVADLPPARRAAFDEWLERKRHLS